MLAMPKSANFVCHMGKETPLIVMKTPDTKFKLNREKEVQLLDYSNLE